MRVRGAVVHGGERKARLHLVGRQPVFLLLELVGRDAREELALLVLGPGETRLQGVDALLERGDARGELSGVGRYVAAIALHADPAALRLVQREVEVFQRAVLLPEPRLERVVEAELQHAPHQRQPRAEVGVRGRLRRAGESGLHAPDARPLLALGGGAERGHVAPGLDAAQFVREGGVALLQLLHGARGEQRVRTRQPLGVGALARLDHVLEGGHALVPASERAVQEQQVAVVLQSLLEVVSGQHRVQVAGLGRIGEVLQLPEPAIARALLARQHAPEHVAVADARNGRVDAPALGIEGIDGALVVLGGLRVGVELGEGVRDGEVGLLHRRIQQVAAAQLHPRRERPLVVAERRVRPAGAEQRLVRVRPVEAHPRQRRPRPRRLIRLQVREAERETGAVLERQELRSGGDHRADGGEERVGIGEPAVAHQRDAEVEARVAGPDPPPALGVAPQRQHPDRLVIATLVHQHVAEQQLFLRLELRRHPPVHLAQRRVGLLEIAPRVPHLRQVEPGAVAHPGGHLVGQQPREALARLVVHAEREVQPALEELRLIQVMRHAVPVLVGEEAREGLELLVLVEIEERIAVVQVADAGDRQLLGVVAGRWRRRRGQDGEHGGKKRRTHAVGPAQELFPVLDLELRLQLPLPVIDLQLQVLGADALLEAQ